MAADDDKAYYWDYIHGDIAVQRNGDMEITESQRFVFTRGTFTFAYRDIPLDRVERVDNIWVEENGQRVGRTEVSTVGSSLRVKWYYPTTSNASRTFNIHYVVHGGLRIYEGGDQVWWKAIFPDRDFPVRSSRVTVHLPAPVAPSDLKVASYGTPAESSIIDPQTVLFTATNIPPRAELEVRVQFPHGLVSASAPAWQAGAGGARPPGAARAGTRRPRKRTA